MEVRGPRCLEEDPYAELEGLMLQAMQSSPTTSLKKRTPERESSKEDCLKACVPKSVSPGQVQKKDPQRFKEKTTDCEAKTTYKGAPEKLKEVSKVGVDPG